MRSFAIKHCICLTSIDIKNLSVHELCAHSCYSAPVVLHVGLYAFAANAAELYLNGQRSLQAAYVIVKSVNEVLCIDRGKMKPVSSG